MTENSSADSEQNAPEGAGTPPPPPGTPSGPTGEPQLVGPDTADSKTMAMLCHLLVIFTGFIGPLIIWLIKKGESKFIDQQGKEALNFALTILIASVALVVLWFIPIIGWVAGCLAWPALMACNIVFGILSTIKVNNGEPYRYPVCIRFIT